MIKLLLKKMFSLLFPPMTRKQELDVLAYEIGFDAAGKLQKIWELEDSVRTIDAKLVPWALRAGDHEDR
mgnify:CR=1 FL=1